MKKRLLKELEDLSKTLPSLFVTETRYERKLGGQLLKEHAQSDKADQPCVDGEGKAIVEDQVYLSSGRPYQKPVNHLSQLKDAYKKGGMNKVAEYCLDVEKQSREIIEKSLQQQQKELQPTDPAIVDAIQEQQETVVLEPAPVIEEYNEQDAQL